MKVHSLFHEWMLGPVTNINNLSFLGIFGPDRFAPDLFLLDEALQTGSFIVTDSGHISVLLVENRLDSDVFIASGMVLEGGTQNRAAQYPVMIPATSRGIELPVRCAEKKQPLTAASQLESSKTILPISARSGRVNQERTWITIDQTIASLRINSRTKDYASAIGSSDLGEYRNVLGRPLAGQLGYAVAIRNDKQIFFYADVFGNQFIYRKLYGRLTQSVAAVARSTRDSDGSLGLRKSDFASFLLSAGETNLKEVPLDSRLAGRVYIAEEPIAASALVHEDKPVQISLRKDAGDKAPRSHDFDQTIIFDGRLLRFPGRAEPSSHQ